MDGSIIQVGNIPFRSPAPFGRLHGFSQRKLVKHQTVFGRFNFDRINFGRDRAICFAVTVRRADVAAPTKKR